MQSEYITPYLKELQQLKLYPSAKFLLINLSHKKKTKKNKKQKAVSRAKQKQLVKSKVPSINYPYFAKIFNFCCKIEIVEKIK